RHAVAARRPERAGLSYRARQLLLQPCRRRRRRGHHRPVDRPERAVQGQGRRMSIMLYNTMTRRKERFVPADPGRVTMYVCGPTVYNYIHVGNARPVVVFDVLYRLLRAHHPKVVYARNITDVDDKINQ